MVIYLAHRSIAPNVNKGFEKQGNAPVRIAIISGFLGVGKSSMAFAVASYLRKEKNAIVGIITNDQGNALVDTEFMRSGGFDVEEVRGGCFCVRFDEFVNNAYRFVSSRKPDLIIAESIGTATNLLSAVISPMREFYANDFSLSPLITVVDAYSLSKCLKEGVEPFHVANTIPVHQIREAEVIVLSKCDLVDEADLGRIIEYVKNFNQEAVVIPYSFISKRSVDVIADLMISNVLSTKKPFPVDQRIFAREKAILGWCNYYATIRSDMSTDARAFLVEVMKEISKDFDDTSVAHLKAMLISSESALKLSVVGDTLRIDDIRGGRTFVGEGRIVINARICSSPEKMKQTISNAMRKVAESAKIKLVNEGELAFTPKPELMFPHIKKGSN